MHCFTSYRMRWDVDTFYFLLPGSPPLKIVKCSHVFPLICTKWTQRWWWGRWFHCEAVSWGGLRNLPPPPPGVSSPQMSSWWSKKRRKTWGKAFHLIRWVQIRKLKLWIFIWKLTIFHFKKVAWGTGNRFPNILKLPTLGKEYSDFGPIFSISSLTFFFEVYYIRYSQKWWIR